ncbi:MAG TPA: TIR domain-containing protein [Leptolyngbyaceae cyanobacterium M65_K2018_010]|nr:TIR domain-containing protein [Leptolyngbyaceae cyanobacterium M65_K2018_010]
MTVLQDAFISYGRPDSKDFALWLHQQLTARGYQVWIDEADIPFAVDYQVHIDQSIERIHNLIFVLSPHAVNSPHCADELNQALRFNKRIIPLMHVEQISQATWQRRHPQGTEADWITYQARGLHSATANINPAIAKLNWINFREGVDDRDRALQQLIHTLEDRKAYIHQHTDYLVQALNWQHHQRQVRYLLSGARRRAAEAWLKQAIEDDPPFAQPTDLHCEFITESTKYAEDQLTQVFLCFSDEDSDLKESMRRQLDRVAPTPTDSLSGQVRQILRRAGFTVWDRRQDLGPGDRIPTAINRGIEGADNFVFLLSPASVQSSHCLAELNYALKLHKRILPVLVKTIDPATRPKALENLRLIDLREMDAASALAEGSRQLMAALGEEAVYFREHKHLLVQALKWERQRYNPSVLLRGGERRYYEGWLKAARQRHYHQPIEVQEKFVAESLTQPATQTLDVFLIADPVDLDFTRRLNHTLQLQGKSTWFDASNWRDDANTLTMVDEAIESAENFLVVLSPQTLKNPDCLADLNYAQTLSKRLIGVANGPITRSTLPPALTTVPIVNFQDQEGDFSANFGELYRILESDADYIDQHTRLLMRALEWEKSGRDDSLLLRRKALDQANSWLAQAAQKIPAPNAQQLAFLAASRQLPFRKVKWRSLGLSSAAITLLVYLLRLVGGLQPLELAAYDALLRRRPSEPQDSHLLLVVVDEASGNWLRDQVKQGRYQPGLGTIPDGALAEGLAALQVHQPAVIGLDFYRDFAATPALASQLQQHPNVFGICKAAYADSPGVEQPPELPSVQVGFNDFELDPNNFVRRHYLKHEADPPDCDTANAFSLKLAQAYLQGRGVDYTDPFLPDGGIQDMALGPRRVPQLWAGGILTSQSAGYPPLHGAALNGYQTMVNYRHHQGDPNQFAPQITVQELLTGQFAPALVRGRIVLIGYKDLTDRNADSYNTPQGELPGVVVHGQMVSQLVSAAVDNRKLIGWLPVWAETLWIGLWALLAGLLVRQMVRPLPLALGALAGVIALVGLCYGLLVWAGLWLPLVPPLLAGAGTAAVLAYLNYQVRNP